MKLLMIISIGALIVSAVSPSDIELSEYEFIDYMDDNYEKMWSYNDSERDNRQNSFELANQKIVKHNKSNATYEMYQNYFAVFYSDEKKTRLGIDIEICKNCTKSSVIYECSSCPESVDKPFGGHKLSPFNSTSYDLRDTYGHCLNVKDQHGCAASWAFAAVTVFEFFHCVQNNETIKLSEQQLIDCDTGNGGCNGGWHVNALSYILKNGIVKSSDYPYTSRNGTCRFDASKVINTWENQSLFSDKIAYREPVINQRRPVAVTILVIDSFYYYDFGVYANPNCNQAEVNHAVVLVGYGNERNINHWIGLNSWGTTWGDDGYFKIQRGVNMCNIESQIAYHDFSAGDIVVKQY